MKIGIIGGSGYTGGELLRLLLRHPNAEIVTVTSEANVGKKLSSVHPNLRGVTDMKFASRKDLDSYDLLFVCTPHGVSMNHMPEYLEKATKVIPIAVKMRLLEMNLIWIRWAWVIPCS